MKLDSSSKVSLQDHSVGLILICVGLKKHLAHVNLIRKIFQSHDKTQDTYTFKMFEVLIGRFKLCGKIKFHSKAPMLKYHQNSFDSFCFSGLFSAFSSINQTESLNSIAMRIE